MTTAVIPAPIPSDGPCKFTVQMFFRLNLVFWIDFPQNPKNPKILDAKSDSPS